MLDDKLEIRQDAVTVLEQNIGTTTTSNGTSVSDVHGGAAESGAAKSCVQ